MIYTKEKLLELIYPMLSTIETERAVMTAATAIVMLVEQDRVAHAHEWCERLKEELEEASIYNEGDAIMEAAKRATGVEDA